MVDLSRWPDADAILEEALALPREARQAFLYRRAGHDLRLLNALETVLAESDEADGFLTPGGALEGSVFEQLVEELPDPAAEPRLVPGRDRLGPYEIVADLGRGGMGEVYRARDTKLKRDVALKVLPHRFTDDAERLERFQREALVLASLSHPNVGAIYDVEEHGGVRALVLELVEGPTLADRVREGPLPLEETLRVAGQIAGALDAAHERGIIHRDLKPANVKVTPTGLVKVLDFGLAKAFEKDSGSATPRRAESPTLTSTDHRAGAVMGTVAYMSPEQARGQRIDHRTDIWAFGCVLYEMLTGQRTFQGETSTEIIARVLERQPDFSKLPAGTPPAIRRLLRRCLEKSPRRRLASIVDAELELEEARVGTPPDEAEAPARVAPRGVPWRSLGTAAGLGAVIAGLAVWALLRPGPPVVTRLALPVPPGDELIPGRLHSIAISPDGRTVVYRAERDGALQLFRRFLDEAAPQPIRGTVNGATPFFSPDGRWIGFTDDTSSLARVPVDGGPVARIAPAPGGAKAAWTEDGTIVFASATGRVVERVAASGGTPTSVTTLDESRGDVVHEHPEVVAGTDVLLFTRRTQDGREVVATRLSDPAEITTLAEGSQPRVLPTGHLVFARDHALWAAPFDATSLRLRGEPVPVLDGVEAEGETNDVQFAISAAGTLAYVPWRGVQSERSLVWVDRDGRMERLPLDPREFNRLSLSPDGSRLAVSFPQDGNTDIWTYDLDRGALTRLTFDPALDTAPLWTPDGRGIVFRSDRQRGVLFQVAADGTGRERPLNAPGPYFLTPYSWTPDGRSLIFSLFRSYRDQGIATMPWAAEPADVEVLLDGPYAELKPAVSPDGRWIAYQSDESGRFEVYARPFPDVDDGRWQISTAGGSSPRWHPDGRALFYYDGTGVVVAPIRAGATFSADPPRRLFEFAAPGDRLGPDFEVSRDGQRFLMIREARSSAQSAQLVLVQNWFEELKRLVPLRR